LGPPLLFTLLPPAVVELGVISVGGPSTSILQKIQNTKLANQKPKNQKLAARKKRIRQLFQSRPNWPAGIDRVQDAIYALVRLAKNWRFFANKCQQPVWIFTNHSMSQTHYGQLRGVG
jgi:hypothetical protein